MKTIKIGPLEIRGDIKATRKQLDKRFGHYLTAKELEQLDAKVNPKKKKK